MSVNFSSNSLGALPYQSGVVTRQISAENPTGEKGGACIWDPTRKTRIWFIRAPPMDLGRGWKVRPFIRVKAGETVTLADIAGPGCINQFWITSDLPEYRALVLRFYWDDETTPSVEVPMGDFFAMGHDAAPHLVSSLPVTVGPHRGCASYWQMPFRRHARITLQNDGPVDANIVAYRVLYKLHDVPDEAAYFHAQWRRSMTRRDYPEHVIVDGVQGSGLYVGTYLAWSAFSRGWWGEGEVKFYLDGDGGFPPWPITARKTTSAARGASINIRSATRWSRSSARRFWACRWRAWMTLRGRAASACIAGTSWTASVSGRFARDGAGAGLVAARQIRAADR